MQAIAPVAALLFSVALLLTGSGLQGALLPVRAHLESFTTLEVGILGANYFLGFAAGCRIGSRLVRRVGHIRTFTAMVSLASAMVLVHAMVLEPVVWWVCRGVTGLSFAVLFMVIESWLNERSTNENRGRMFSIYTIINFSVVAVGQMMLTLADPQAFTLFASAAILICLAALPVALTRAEAPALLETARISVAHLYRRSPVGFAGAGVVGLANGAFWSLAPVFVLDNPLGGGAGMVAVFMSLAVISGAIAQWPFGHVSDRMDRRIVILVSCIGSAAVGLAMALFFDRWAAGPWVLPCLFGWFVFPLYALCAALMNDCVGTGEFVEAAGVLLMLFAVGSVAGSVGAAATMQVLGPGGLFFFTAAVHGTLAVFTLTRMQLRAPPPLADHEPFVESVQAAYTVAPIDPHPADEEGARPGSSNPAQ
ncbi:MAG: MFS transporter [Gammaproteobacteria bacterium]|nr:MFS transporter [Gammaproteobacteria bacterium]MDE0413093.1 MFS transporter [Gammaproteobacteria bacterium]